MKNANGAQMVYNRAQTGHSLTKHLIFGMFVLWIPSVYYAVSPNHFYHV